MAGLIPILIIYRKYYGTNMMLLILGIFYAAVLTAGYIIEFLFAGLGLSPPSGRPRSPPRASAGTTPRS